MCCFSPVGRAGSAIGRLFQSLGAGGGVKVSQTAIFARALEGEEQALVYSMKISVAGDVAMLLPLPVVPGGGESALTFVDFSKHAHFFEDLRALFAPPMPQSRSADLPKSRQRLPRLVVHRVGSFEASFVPSPSDWDRIDPRFRLPTGVFERLGDYADHGFAVFRLAPGKETTIHPMAFRFRSRAPERLFFPTVHVHDGEVHEVARFDHELYYQAEATAPGDERSMLRPSADGQGLLLGGQPVSRRRLSGKLPNRDTWIDGASSDPAPRA